MAARYTRADYRRFASILRSSVQLAGEKDVTWSPEEIIRDIANAIAYEFEKDNPGKTGFNRKQFFVLTGLEDPKE